MMECEDESELQDPAAPSGAVANPLQIVMHRQTFDRACGGGTRFVVFGPFIELKRGRIILVSHAEALPEAAIRAPPPTAAAADGQFSPFTCGDQDSQREY